MPDQIPFIVCAGLAIIFLLQIFLFNQQHTIMTQNEAVLAYAQRIDEASNKNAAAITEVANDLKDLRTRIAESGVNADTLAFLDRIAAKAEAQADQLTALGKDPEQETPPASEETEG